MNIAIRVDASQQIGTGHVMRCLTLAGALRPKGATVVFVSREHPGHLSDMVEAKGFEVIRLEPGPNVDHHQVEIPALAHAAWLGASQSADADLTIAALQCSAPWDWIIVDHYSLDQRWDRALRPYCRRIMVIDDLADREHDCDLLLDQNLLAGMASRYPGKVPAACGLLLGPDYALLQPEYADLHLRVPPREGQVRRILVSFGGADSANLTGMAIEAFLSLGRADIVLDVVANPASPRLVGIERQIAGHENVAVHKGLPSLAPLMVQADLAIGAGGATSWERCCLGLPSLVITLAENQKPIASELDRQGYVRWLGHKDEVDATKLARAMQVVLDTGLEPEWSRHCQALVDGQGAEQVASFILLDSQTRLKTRPARLDDEDLLLQWANDPLVRRNAFHPQAIDPATHRKWFFHRLRDLVHCRLFIVETENGLPVGQVRFELTADGWVIDYALDPRARDRGLGKPLLQAAMLALRESTDQTLVFARVKPENAPSNKIFEGLGFQPDSRGGGEIVYRRVL
jgi:UDP-2,4-diacetamido-2,4,6-trideoxy-beta-L-altropyranose hydrolase